MVTSFIAASATMFFALQAGAVPRCTLGSSEDPSVCSYGIPPIEKVIIQENGAGKSKVYDPSVNCPAFHLDERKVRFYFRKSGLLAPLTSPELLTWSPCYASGILKFSDGTEAEWVIFQYGSGQLTFAGRPEVELYCIECDAIWSTQ